jgi:hypothetical protein
VQAVISHDPSAIAAALLDAVSDEARIRRRGSVAREATFARFDWSVLLRRDISICEWAVGR